jgi:meso-butanediol dehydrogenase/(S,S)-butanediol dehydrogenase/diacetyl reductase
MTSEVATADGRTTPADQVIIITGGGSGIGRATSDLFADKHVKLVLVGRRRELLERAARAAVDRGSEALALAYDLTDSDAASKVVRQARHRFGRVDVLVNNAGVPGEGVPLHEVSDALWNELCETNLAAAFRMCRAVLPIFLEQHRGVILNVASTAALVAMRNMAVYGATKAGLLALTRAVARDYGPLGVRCNAVCPGTTATPMTKNVLDLSRRRAAIVRGIPLQRVAQPREIATAIVHLCGDDSSYVNGAVLTVDGGQVAR